MDVKRDPAILKRKKQRQTILAVIGVLVLIGISARVMNLKPAAPTVDANAAWTGKVIRGPLVREVKGSGTLVPEDIRWITATTSGRVERIVLQAGTCECPDVQRPDESVIDDVACHPTRLGGSTRSSGSEVVSSSR